MGDLPVGGGGAAEMAHSTPFGAENWAAAERATCEIIRKVQPTPVSEERRKEVVDYIQRLIRDCVGAEVFPYGSVPLKTYLPDGDIDLTAFGGANVEDTLAEEMHTVLEDEEKNPGAEFVVKDVQLIRAEVKLVKCIVQDIVVDVSFNQIGGLCTLCFLEQVDCLIGRDHLFKRSIILIKAWCYYESRILGAHHGLISTYALETLVLYIFHLYHSALDGPLAVLYKFLDYFSKFDWDSYCVSLNGTVRVSSLPAFVVEIPEDSDKELLLSNDFLNHCVGMFSVPSRVGDISSRVFPRKHLNIVDPLKETNNLGRSVSKGNFYRIRSAFSYGARKLARILLLPQDSITNELQRFFANTMARHGGGQRPDVQDFDRLLISNRPVSAAPFPDAAFCRADNFDEYMDEYPVSSADWQSSSGKLSDDLPHNAADLGSDDLTLAALDGLKVSADASACRTPSIGESDDSDQKSASISGDSNQVEADQSRASMSGMAESLSSTDLTGDYDCYVQHLQYGRWCYEYGLGMHPMPVPPFPTAPYLVPIMHYKQNGFAHHHNGFHPSPPIYAMPPVLMPAVPYPWEDVPKHRGTGTYLPNTNMPAHGNRPPAVRGRSQVVARSSGRHHHNGRNPNFHEPPQPIDRPVANANASPSENGHHNANGIEVEAVHPPVAENSRPQRGAALSPRTPPGQNRGQTAQTREQERVSLRSAYRLKDEDDFPPLSS